MSQTPPNPYESPNAPNVNVVTPPKPTDSGDLTAIDWVIVVLCSGIGCIIGIIRLIQGKPSGGKMLGMSVLFIVIWTIVRIVLTAATQQMGP